MRRILIPLAALAACVSPASSPGALTVFESRSVDVDGVRYPFQLLLPTSPLEGQSPLVVFLHGAGERGADNSKQLTWLPLAMAGEPMRGAFPCHLLAVQCPSDEKWVDVPWGDATPSPMPQTPSRAMRAVIAAIAKVERDKAIDPRRVYLTGLSMGGYGAWDLAMRMPGKFAAVVPVCGGGDPSKAALLRDVSIWIWHGDKDAAVPVARSRQMAEALQAAGSLARYSELPGVGHDSWRQAYARDGAIAWMFEQRRP